VPVPVIVYVRFGTVMLRLVMVKAPLSDPDVLSKIPVPLVIEPISGTAGEPDVAVPENVPEKVLPSAIVNVIMAVTVLPLKVVCNAALACPNGMMVPAADCGWKGEPTGGFPPIPFGLAKIPLRFRVNGTLAAVAGAWKAAIATNKHNTGVRVRILSTSRKRLDKCIKH
jgi:hypothetical protein